jgi:tRNA(Ile)-lysidine synthase
LRGFFGQPELNPQPAQLHACEQAVDDWFRREAAWAEAGRTMAVAFSGGADSTALLLAVQRRWSGRVVAFHVHHGLQAAADGFEAHARAFCSVRGIEIAACRVDAASRAGQSPEDAARRARYEALAGLSRSEGAAVVLLGQHADDQAETLFLALSRGAGLPGLAAMPDRFERHGARFGRPLLPLPGSVLRAYVSGQGADFVSDPTNADERFTRNRIRAVLMPAWERCFPGFRTMVSRSAGHAAQAQRLLDELAQIDLATTGSPPAIRALQALSRDRQANAVRFWLRRNASVAPSAAQMEALLDQVAHCRTRGHSIRLKVAEAFVYRDGEHLAYGAADII